ncbi:MAG: hypothetical protein ACE5KM_14945 [Planctomycetaceae bacterium]
MSGQTHPALSQFHHQRFGDWAADRDWVQQRSLEFYANDDSLTPGDTMTW